MDTSERGRIEALLLAERDRTLAELHRIEQEEAESQSVTGGGLARTQWTQADAASDVQEEESDFISASRASTHLAELDDALRLLADDPDALTRCRSCARAIPRRRLDLVPWSRLCGRCVREVEDATTQRRRSHAR
jgi:RNA polymerase-binding transcription factor DksA